MRPIIKDIADTITVNTKKAVLTEHPYTEPNLYKYYIKNTAGNYWIDSDLISLSHGEWSKQQCAQTFECIEKQVCRTITHETVHRVIYGQTNIKTCCAFDNIARSLQEYGLW
jgi:hypothetical protein